MHVWAGGFWPIGRGCQLEPSTMIAHGPQRGLYDCDLTEPTSPPRVSGYEAANSHVSPQHLARVVMTLVMMHRVSHDMTTRACTVRQLICMQNLIPAAENDVEMETRDVPGMLEEVGAVAGSQA